MQPKEKKTASLRKKEIVLTVLTLVIAPIIAVSVIIVISKIQDHSGPGLSFYEAFTNRSARTGLESTAPPPIPENFNPVQVVSELPSLTEFNIVSAGTASKKVSDEDLVIGVVINGEARAYPLNMMTGPQREVFNDDLGGVPISATW